MSDKERPFLVVNADDPSDHMIAWETSPEWAAAVGTSDNTSEALVYELPEPKSFVKQWKEQGSE